MTTATSARWTDAMRSTLISAIMKQKRAGKGSDNGFKKDTWSEIISKFNEAHDSNYDKSQLNTQHNSMKSKYIVFKQLIEKSGFGWDESCGAPTAAPHVWDEYIASHPEAKQFREKRLALFQETRLIFQDSVANGEYASASSGF